MVKCETVNIRYIGFDFNIQKVQFPFSVCIICVMLICVCLCVCGYALSGYASSLHRYTAFYPDPEHRNKNQRCDFSGDMMKRTFHVSPNVFPLRSIIKKCVDQTRGSYQIRPGKANYTDNNLSL